jgi:catalase
MGDAPEFIKQRHIRNCHAADPAYGAGVCRTWDNRRFCTGLN